MTWKRGPGSMLHSGLANSGRVAGDGITHDRYDDESGYPGYTLRSEPVRLPHDGTPQDELCGPVKIIIPAKKEVRP